MRDRLLAIQQDKEKYSFTVDELGLDGKPLTVYFTKLTVREDTLLRKQHPNFYDEVSAGKIPPMDSLVDIICLKSVNEEGGKIFDESAKQTLRGMDIQFIIDLAAKILEHLFDSPSIEEAEKNS